MRVVRMLHRAALAAFVLLLAALTLCALALTAQNGVGDNRMLQVVTLARQPFLKACRFPCACWRRWRAYTCCWKRSAAFV
ncbi:MAG: hypothetical protein ACLR07_13920 [Christensenellales bacterium]